MLGIGKTAKGYDLEYACANTHGKINKWAKYKPVRHDFMGELTEAQRASTKFGMNIGISLANDPNLNNIKEGYKGSAWSYLPPNRTNDNCRSTDFEGYYHSAVSFVRTGLKKGEVKSINIIETDKFNFSVIYNNSLNQYCIQLSDLQQAFGNLGDLYLFGIIYDSNPLENASAKMLESKVAEDPITSGSGYLTFTFKASDIGANRWIMLCLASRTINYSFCIPFDDNNYPVIKLKVEQRYLIEANAVAMGVVGGSRPEIGYWNTNPFPSNNGNANVILWVRMTNNAKTPAVIGSNYMFRSYFDSRYTTDLILCDASGTQIAPQTLSPGQTNYFYFRGDKMFKEFVDSLIVSELRAYLSIQAYNKNAANPTWQVVGGQVPILVKK